jgi:hypothetical protein
MGRIIILKKYRIFASVCINIIKTMKTNANLSQSGLEGGDGCGCGCGCGA